MNCSGSWSRRITWKPRRKTIANVARGRGTRRPLAAAQGIHVLVRRIAELQQPERRRHAQRHAVPVPCAERRKLSRRHRLRARRVEHVLHRALDAGDVHREPVPVRARQGLRQEIREAGAQAAERARARRILRHEAPAGRRERMRPQELAQRRVLGLHHLDEARVIHVRVDLDALDGRQLLRRQHDSPGIARAAAGSSPRACRERSPASAPSGCMTTACIQRSRVSRLGVCGRRSRGRPPGRPAKPGGLPNLLLQNGKLRVCWHPIRAASRASRRAPGSAYKGPRPHRPPGRRGCRCSACRCPCGRPGGSAPRARAGIASR